MTAVPTSQVPTGFTQYSGYLPLGSTFLKSISSDVDASNNCKKNKSGSTAVIAITTVTVFILIVIAIVVIVLVINSKNKKKMAAGKNSPREKITDMPSIKNFPRSFDLVDQDREQETEENPPVITPKRNKRVHNGFEDVSEVYAKFQEGRPASIDQERKSKDTPSPKSTKIKGFLPMGEDVGLAAF